MNEQDSLISYYKAMLDKGVVPSNTTPINKLSLNSRVELTQILLKRRCSLYGITDTLTQRQLEEAIKHRNSSPSGRAGKILARKMVRS